MRGQVSAEYMLLFMVSLSLLGVSAVSLGAIRDSAMRSLDMGDFRASAISLADAVDEVCASGNNNRASVYLASAVEVDSERSEDGWLIRIRGANATVVRDSLCEAKPSSLPKGKVYIENIGGSASFTEP
ncbi:MAG: hypothetical protein V1827_04360 [Candidatus Micrarchaeota archaeon]